MKTRISLLFISVFILSKLNAQQVGHTTITFIDSTRNNRQIGAEIYYPSTVAGNNTPIASGTFTLIAFGHGFVMAWSAYQNFWELLVSEGYIVVYPTTESGISPNHTEFGNDLKFLINKIQGSGVGAVFSSSSIGATSAIMGHSMGGGSSFLAAENNSTITTMVSLAAANTNPSSIAAAQQVLVPTLLFSGTNDCVTPPSQHQDIMYDSTIALYKTQINILGGGHCYFANSNFSCSFGESTCSPSPTIIRENQQDITHDFLKLWLGYFLKNDCQSAQAFQDSLTLSSRISFRQNQSIACITGFKENILDNNCTFFPNPFTNTVNIEIINEDIKTIEIYNVLFEKISQITLAGVNSKESFDFSSLGNSIYFFKINNKYWKKILKSGIN
jgi:hypothetical protein